MGAMGKWITCLVWLPPLALFSADAHAWGLYTHVYFAQLLVWAVPLADPRLRRLAKNLPRLVMAGACLPDLAVIAGKKDEGRYENNHRWETALSLLGAARSDEERALALGYASHLLVDVVAHHHFVPAHENLWLDVPIITHVFSEWAMDAHISPQLFVTPAQLLEGEAARLAAYIADHWDCAREDGLRAVATLTRAEGFLRRTRLPWALYGTAKRLDSRIPRRFDNYVEQTAERLSQINRLLEGETPAWNAEAPCRRAARDRVKEEHSRRQLGLRIPLPESFFEAA